MSKEYVEQHDGGYWIAGKRISRASVVYEFKNGAAPESILRCLPLLRLEEIYGAIAFYLSNQPQIDAYLIAGQTEYEQQRQRERESDPELYKKFEEARALIK